MFQAIRNWWRSGRGKETSRLFVFELTVVMIGVLAAQEISNWAQKRSQEQGVKALHANMMALSQSYYDIARTYDKAVPCLSERANFIMQQAALRKPVDERDLAAVPLIAVSRDPVGIEEFRSLSDRYGFDTADLLFTMQFNLGVAETANRALDDDWSKFQRLNRAFGPVDDDDRAAVRAAGFDAKAQLNRLHGVATAIEGVGGQLKLRPDRHSTFGPIQSCRAMWQNRQSFSGQL